MDMLTWAIRTAGMANARDASKMRIVPMAGCGVGMAARMTRLGEDFLEGIAAAVYTRSPRQVLHKGLSTQRTSRHPRQTWQQLRSPRRTIPGANSVVHA